MAHLPQARSFAVQFDYHEYVDVPQEEIEKERNLEEFDEDIFGDFQEIAFPVKRPRKDVVYHDSILLYCTCGKVDEPSDIVIHKSNEATRTQWFSPKNTSPWRPVTAVGSAYSVESYFYCKHCRRKADHQLNAKYHKVPSTHIDYTKIWDNGDKISLSIGYTFYMFHHKSKKRAVVSSNARLTANVKTGQIYLIKGKHVYNITFFSGNLKPALSNLMSLLTFQDQRAKERFNEWLDLCYEKRGIKYMKHNQCFGIQDKFAHFRFPVLQSLPFHQVGAIPVSMRKKLDQASGLTDMYELFFGISSKKIRKLIRTIGSGKIAYQLKHVLNKTDNIIKVLKTAETGMQDSSNELFPAHMTKNNFKNSDDYKAFQFMLAIHNNDETLFVNRFIKIMPRYHNYGLGNSKQPAFDYYHAVHTIRDIHRLYKEIGARKEDYILPYRGNLTRLHDDLSKDYNKIQHENAFIPYQEGEAERYNHFINDYRFELAPDTHNLIDVGAALNICVGGYGSSAIERNTTIVNVYRNDEIHMCIEVRLPYYEESKEMTLQQAKLSHNRLPEHEEAKIVAEWCDLANVKYHEEGDLRNLHVENKELGFKEAPQVVAY